MRKLSVFLALLMSGGLVWLDVSAQEPNAGVIFFQHRRFKIPFKNDPTGPQVSQLRLYVSRDQGRNWQNSATSAPDEQHFLFSAPNDGLYWFALQAQAKDGKLFPATVDDIRPNLKVIVDTAAPTVQVQALPARNGEVGVSWTVRDDNLDLTLPDAVQLQFRPPGNVNWMALPVPSGSNQYYWNPQTNANVEVRVLARDRAGNVGEDKTTVALALGGVNPSPQYNTPLAAQQPQNGNIPKDVDRKYVNSKQISMSYDLKDFGASGVSAVELWYTRYGAKAWNRLTEYPIDWKNAVEGGQTKKLTFEIQEEGVYGITLVAKSGVGLGERPPQVGDRPQFWIEVDMTKPIVQNLRSIVGTGIDKGKLTVAWSAADKNLGPTPIRLSYAEQRDGPWNTFADKLSGSRYVWMMPEQLPYQFYLRVEAVDLAGNVGEAITPERVKVDLAVPKAVIRDIEPGVK